MTWYKIMFLISATRKGFTSKEIQWQLGLKSYKPFGQWYRNYIKP